MGSWASLPRLWVSLPGSWVRRLSSWVLLLGFAVGFVRRQLSSPFAGFAGRPLCDFCFDPHLCLCFCCLFGCRGFFYFLFFTFFCQRGRTGRRRVSQLFGFLLWNSSVEKSNSRQIFIEIESVILNLLQRSQPSHSRDVSLLNNLEMMLTNKIVLILVLFSKKKKIPTQWHVAKKRTLFFNTR